MVKILSIFEAFLENVNFTYTPKTQGYILFSIINSEKKVQGRKS